VTFLCLFSSHDAVCQGWLVLSSTWLWRPQSQSRWLYRFTGQPWWQRFDHHHWNYGIFFALLPCCYFYCFY